MLSPEQLVNRTVVIESKRKIETILNIINILLIIFLISIILTIQSLFPLVEIKTRNIIFKKKSETTFEIISSNKNIINKEIIINILKDYIYYRETFPNNEKNLLKYFEIKKINNIRKKNENLYLKEISKKNSLRRLIKIKNSNYITNDTIKTEITISDELNNKIPLISNKTIIIKYIISNQFVLDKAKYLNPLGIKIIEYETRNAN